MTTINIANPTEQRYQQATNYYTQSNYYTKEGLSHVLKRQWEFIREPEQKNFLYGSLLLTASCVIFFTKAGIGVGKDIAELLSLKDTERGVVIICCGTGGFLTGLGLSLTGNAILFENSERIERWKKLKASNIITGLMKEEFENDPVWSQFIWPISQIPMYLPTRAPGGQAFDFDSLMQVAETNNGIIKDIFNKRIPLLTGDTPQATRTISYSLDACLKDDEMMIVICKRFRHLAFQKSQERGLSEPTKQLFISYRNALGELVNTVYTESQNKIIKRRADVQTKENVTEQESEQAEMRYNDEMAEFKELFGSSPLSNVDWSVQRNWMEIHNRRWMAEYHPRIFLMFR